MNKKSKKLKKIKKAKKFIKNNKNNLILILLFMSLFISLICNVILLKTEEKVITKIEYKTDENIVFFGDSITRHYKINEFFPNSHIINSGISGDEASDLVERIEDDVYKYNPSKVFLLIGINDLNHKVDEKEILENIQKIVNGIKTNRKYAKIYIQSVYPVNHNSFKEHEYRFNEEVDAEKIKAFNEKLKEICNENNITYIDVFKELSDKEGNLKEIYTVEGLHINDLGYFKVTSVLQKYIYDKK